MKRSTILLICCLCLTVLSGYLRGMIDSRWGTIDLEVAAQAVLAAPTRLGDWTTPEKGKLDEEAAKMLRCAGDFVASFSNSTGDLVNVVMLVGPAGPLAVHTPDVCYGSNNYALHEHTRQVTITDVEGEEHEFSVITFRENSAGERLLRVYYAWNRDGEWVAPGFPRGAFAGVPMLYKIQVATNQVKRDAEDLDAGERFLREALPQLKKKVISR